MHTRRAICETAHITALGLWLGALVMTGAGAAVVFPTLKGLDPRLPEYAAYLGEHWRIAGGQVAARMFRICDGIQFGAGIVAIVSLAFIPRGRHPAMTARWLCLLGAIVILACQRFFFHPGMNADMHAYWDAARAGDNESAGAFRAAFEAAHPIASRLLVADTLCVLGTLVFGAWSAARSGARRAYPNRLLAASTLP